MLRILFVDDEANVIEAMRRTMRPMRNEWSMEFVLSGEAALESLALGAVAGGVKQQGLLTAEKVLLGQTLSGAVKMLIELLGRVGPAASSRASRLQRYVLEVTKPLALPNRLHWG